MSWSVLGILNPRGKVNEILKDLAKAIGMLGEANGLLERCMKAMDVSVPRALLWQNISKLKSGSISPVLK